MPRCHTHQLAALFIVLLCSLPAPADSGVGIDNHLGNALHPTTPWPGGVIDELGYSLFSTSAFSPSGILYPLVVEYPYRQIWAPPLWPEDPQPVDDWEFGGRVEFGFLFNAGTKDTASFREFADFDEGPIVNRFALLADNAASNERFSLIGGGPGRDDQYFGLEYSRPGSLQLRAWYNSIPHTFSSNARVLWNGAGSGMLTLPEPLVPGQSSPEQVRETVLSRPESTLQLKRERIGLAGILQTLRNIEVFWNASTEWRDGSRPFGGGFDYPTLGQVTETVEPINYVTHEVDAGIRYLGKTYQFNFTYSGSFFINDSDNLVWENPGLSLLQPDFVPPRGRIALAPDNRFHQLMASSAVQLPFLHGRWTSSVAYNRKRQNDELLPPTISTGIGNNTGIPVNFDLWNSTAALSQTTAEARIQTTLIQSELSLQPTRRLRTTLEFRYLNEDNDTDFSLLNPLTGEFGRIPLDGGLLFDDGIFQPGRPGDLVRIRSTPFATDELTLRATADYRLANRTRMGLSFTREEKDHANRERSETRDNRFRLQLSNRGGPWASLRLAAEYARRNGSSYNLNPLAPFLSSSLDGFVPLFEDGQQPLELANLRVFDLASRDQWLADLQARFNPGTRSDLALSARLENNDFDAEFGLRREQRISANTEWSYQFADQGSAFIYYSYQQHERESAGINDAGPQAADAFAGGVVFPLQNRWLQHLDESNHAAGIGITGQWGPWLLQADYTFGYARSRRQFFFASAGSLTGGLGTEDADAIPTQTFEQHLFRVSLRYPVSNRISARLFYRLESEDIKDPNFLGLDDPVIDNQLFLLAVPEDFTAHIVGLMLEIGL